MRIKVLSEIEELGAELYGPRFILTDPNMDLIDISDSKTKKLLDKLADLIIAKCSNLKSSYIAAKFKINDIRFNMYIKLINKDSTTTKDVKLFSSTAIDNETLKEYLEQKILELS